jgi:competence protein ComEC
MNEALSDGLIDLVDLLGRTPGAEWHVASPLIPAIAVFYVLLYTASHPGGRRAIRATAAVFAGLILLWWVWSPRASADGETLRVTFFDVGQGDATMIELPDRRTILIDGGPAYETLDMGRAVIGPYLWNRGIFHLDDVVATHPQLDHVGGLIWTVRQFRIGRYWTNGISRQETFYRRLQAALEGLSTVQHTAEEGRLIVDSGPCRLRILNPPAKGSSPPLVRKVRTGSELNDLSVVTRLDCGPHSFLFTGDVETEAIVRLQASEWFDAEVVKVPHHGSKSSFQPQWVAHLNADAAVVSVGRINPYGHPSAGVIDAYERRGIHLLRTDRQGAIQITASLSSSSLEIHETRDNALVPTTLGPAMLNTERENLARLWRQWIHRGIWEA